MNCVEIDNVSKKYLIRNSGAAQYGTLRDAFANMFKRSEPVQKSVKEFYAVKDVSFNVAHGDVVGLIGRNGAGKSTLLKILSGITKPTSGCIRIDGRVGSLLEVGTGFHPELTGRENIFVNGTILGLSRSEIAKKFDEIVDFSGVEEFLDTPVKRYSSGMVMRLAFSVAAHIEPEVLVVDEVLAVGDVDFQKKCIGKMKEVSKHGRTVFFVTHNMAAISQLCNKVAYLSHGSLVDYGTDVDKIMTKYLFQDSAGSAATAESLCDRKIDNEYFTLKRFRAVDKLGSTRQSFGSNSESILVEVEFDLKMYHPALNFGVSVVNENGVTVFWSVTTDRVESDWPKLQIGRNRLRCEIPARYLNEGEYRFDLFSSIHVSGYFSEPGKTDISFNINIHGGLSDSPYWRAIRPGVMAPVFQWVRL